jgi:uncharacterized protein YndB with AHSA1/START domain
VHIAVPTTIRDNHPADSLLVTNTHLEDLAAANMHVIGLRSSAMRKDALAGDSARAIRPWKICVPTEIPLGISVLTSVHADRHRIYQALTVPEYVEAWFSAPGAIEGSTAVSAGERFLLISYWSAQHQQFGIFCSYQVRRRSKLVFTWRYFTPVEATASMVKIRLLGDFERTTVHVTHVGLKLSDQQWHESLWTLSLRKLSKLF